MNSRPFARPVGRDIHHERRRQLPVLNVVVNISGPPGGLEKAVFVLGFDHEQAAQEASVDGELGRPAVVGVTVLHGVAKHDIGPVAAQGCNEWQLVLPVVAKKTVGQAKVFARTQAHDFAGRGGLSGADFGTAAGAKFAPGEIDDADGLTGGAGGQ